MSILIGVAITLAFAAIFAFAFHRTWRAQSWPETKCDILAVRAEQDKNSKSERWDVMVSLRYEVGGVHYENHDANPEVFGVVQDREEAEATVARYPVGARVACFYDPEEPQTCFLDRSAPPWSALVFGGAIGLALVGMVAAVILLLVQLRRARR